jgi:hypothetical protein
MDVNAVSIDTVRFSVKDFESLVLCALLRRAACCDPSVLLPLGNAAMIGGGAFILPSYSPRHDKPKGIFYATTSYCCTRRLRRD